MEEFYYMLFSAMENFSSKAVNFQINSFWENYVN